MYHLLPRSTGRLGLAVLIPGFFFANTHAAINVTGDVSPTYNGSDDPWDAGVELILADTADATLSITAGSSVSAIDAYLGYTDDMTSQVTVSGTDSSLNIAAALSVGYLGDCTLLIEDGGTVNSSAAYTCTDDNSRAWITITGAGSSWVNTGLIHIGYKGSSGNLLILDGGYLSSNGGKLGYYSSNLPYIVVKGYGSMWENTGDLYVGAGSGDARMHIIEGGYVSNNNAIIGERGSEEVFMEVTDPGSTWINNGTIYVGQYGDGRFNIQDGGYVSSHNGIIGTQSTSDSIAAVYGPNAVWDIDAGLYVGYYGEGSLVIEDGGQVNVNGSFPGAMIGNYADSYGFLRVRGADSALNVYDGEFVVGADGEADLHILDAGTIVSQNTAIAKGAGSIGSANVSGADSYWQINGEFIVGYQGDAELLIENGGIVHSTGNGIYVGYQADSRGSVIVSGADSIWTTESMLNIGVLSSQGSLRIDNGGRVTSNGGASIGSSVGSGSSATSVTVSGEGSLWDVGFLIRIKNGNPDGSALLIEDGGKVLVRDYWLDIGSSSYDTEPILITVTGQNSTLDANAGIWMGDGSNSQNKLIINNSGTVNTTYISVNATDNNLTEITVSDTGSSLNLSSGILLYAYYQSSTVNLNVLNGAVFNSNTGTLDIRNGGTTLANISGNGSAWHITDTLEVGRDTSSTSGDCALFVSDGGIVTVGNTLQVLQNGRIEGDGTIQATQLLNDGLIEPGVDGIGILDIIGDYTQQSDGRLAIELTENTITTLSNDELAVSGLATLDGALLVNLVDDPTINLGESFDVLQATGGITGSFTTVDVPAGFNVIYNPNSIVLAKQLVGDKNNDGFVGLDDLDIVLQNWNQQVPAGSWTHGDSSGDGYVGLEDLDLILAHWNTGSPPTLAELNIPEPASIGLLMLCLTTLAQRRHRVSCK